MRIVHTQAMTELKALHEETDVNDVHWQHDYERGVWKIGIGWATLVMSVAEAAEFFRAGVKLSPVMGGESISVAEFEPSNEQRLRESAAALLGVEPEEVVSIMPIEYQIAVEQRRGQAVSRAIHRLSIS